VTATGKFGLQNLVESWRSLQPLDRGRVAEPNIAGFQQLTRSTNPFITNAIPGGEDHPHKDL
jgi:hypothetical protein